MATSRRSFIRNLCALTGIAGVTHVASRAVEAGPFRRRRYCRSSRPSIPTTPTNPMTEGFRDIPGTVMRIPKERGKKEIVEIPTAETKRGYALHVGVNWTSPSFYGSTNNLNACVNDAERMREITTAYKFASSLLTNEYATSTNVGNDIVRAAQKLREGDLFVITYSGHGASLDDESGDESSNDDQHDVLDDPKGEPDGLDETWCLHDRMLLDDELFSLWKRFKPGVRILVILDCCHSGTAVRSVLESIGRARDYQSTTGDRDVIALDGAASEIGAFLFSGGTSSLRGAADMSGITFAPPAIDVRQRQKVRTLPSDYNFRLMEQHSKFNRELQKRIKDEDRAAGRTKLHASVMLLAACQDSQLAREEGRFGLFTRSIFVTLGYPFEASGPQPFEGSHEVFLNRLKTRIGAPAQVPNLYRIGVDHPDFFHKEAPFVV